MSFNNHISNIKEMNAYLRDKINTPKKKYKNYKTFSTILNLLIQLQLLQQHPNLLR